MKALGGALLFLLGTACGAPAMGQVEADSGPVVVVPKSDAGPARTDGGLRDAGAQPDAGPPPPRDAGTCPFTPQWNFVVNAGFECAPSTPWSVSSGVGTVIDAGHSGSNALKVVADSLGQALVGQDNVVNDTGGQVFCAQLWVRGTSPEMRLEVRVSPSGKGSAFSSPLGSDGGWVKVPPGAPMAVSSERGESLSVLAKTQAAAVGQTLIIDDVELWPSASGRCDEH